MLWPLHLSAESVWGIVFAVSLAAVSSVTLALGTTVVVVPIERSGPQVLDANGLPIAGGLFNPCTGELVDLTGSSTITVSEVLNNGGRRAIIDVETKGTGVGQASRIPYPIREDQSFDVTGSVSGGLAFESVFTDKIRIMGPGNVDDWMLRATFRITVNDLGHVLINLIKISDQDGCTGRALTNAQPDASTLAAPAGLVAAYSFDEGSGTTISDLSGNANAGTIRGATFAAGKAETALRFDGVDDWVTIPHSQSLALTTGMTIEAWVQPTSRLSGWETVVLKERGSMDLAYALYAHDGAPLVNGVAAPAGYVNVGGVHRATRGNSATSVGDWTYLAVTYDGSRLRLYVNGALIASRAQSGNIAGSVSPLRIGGNGAWTGEFFAGLVDDVRIYKRALRPEEIVRDMNTPIR